MIKATDTPKMVIPRSVAPMVDRALAVFATLPEQPTHDDLADALRLGARRWGEAAEAMARRASEIEAWLDDDVAA